MTPLRIAAVEAAPSSVGWSRGEPHHRGSATKVKPMGQRRRGDAAIVEVTGSPTRQEEPHAMHSWWAPAPSAARGRRPAGEGWLRRDPRRRVARACRRHQPRRAPIQGCPRPSRAPLPGRRGHGEVGCRASDAVIMSVKSFDTDAASAETRRATPAGPSRPLRAERGAERGGRGPPIPRGQRGDGPDRGQALGARRDRPHGGRPRGDRHVAGGVEPGGPRGGGGGHEDDVPTYTDRADHPPTSGTRSW